MAVGGLDFANGQHHELCGSASPNIPDVPVARSAAWEQTVRIRGPIMAVLMAAMLRKSSPGS
jgi:hypothetical protein